MGSRPFLGRFLHFGLIQYRKPILKSFLTQHTPCCQQSLYKQVLLQHRGSQEQLHKRISNYKEVQLGDQLVFTSFITELMTTLISSEWDELPRLRKGGASTSLWCKHVLLKLSPRYLYNCILSPLDRE